jgi:hypothetical protein
MKSFFKGVFSEADGSPSFGRCITLPIVAGVLCWDSAYLHYTHLLPDPLVLAAQSGFMAVFYGTAKASDILKKSPSP